MTAVIYTDASYNHVHDIAACGYLVIVNGEVVKRDVYLLEKVVNISRAEIWAMVKGLQFCFMMKGIAQIQANTDHINIVQRKRTSENYKELDETIAMIREGGIKLAIYHVKAHAKNKNNNEIDRACYKALRNHLKKEGKPIRQQPKVKSRYQRRFSD